MQPECHSFLPRAPPANLNEINLSLAAGTAVGQQSVER
jgi:hypothetical protein